MKQSTCCGEDEFYELPTISTGMYGAIVINKVRCVYCHNIVRSYVVDNSGNISPKGDDWRFCKTW